MKRAATLTVATAIALTPMSGALAADGAHAGTPVYTVKDSHRTVHLSVGKKFKVRTKVNSGTGYKWRWQKHPDRDVVRYKVKTVRKVVYKPPRPGSPITTTYKFKVVGTGTTTLKLRLVGPTSKVAKRIVLTQSD
ncbi:MAG: protease inhibitor I42 family protein [Frankiaceae bacterium]|nr:protease inhibitor I42 family protein [Frankiaceae bacterium]MBV9872553.1 protease inhibitor I42 family protein [Frankiaceae bacterium]